MLYQLSYLGTQHCSIRCLLSPLPLIKESEVPSLILALACDCDPVTINLLREMSFCLTSGCGKPRPSRVQSVVSSQGSLDSDMQGKCCTKLNFG